MGPYCNFCGTRCFAYLPENTPAHILRAYGTSTIIATCPGGQKFEREKIGYCYDDIQKAIQQIAEAEKSDVCGWIVGDDGVTEIRRDPNGGESND